MSISFAFADKSAVDLKRITKVYESGQFSPGPVCKEFEDSFKALHGRKYGFFVNSGTDALRMALLALKEKYKWPDGASVICPAVTFIASANTIVQAGLKPLFIDVGMNDYNLNPWMMERILESHQEQKSTQVVAIMAVHLFGQIADMKEIMRVAKKFKLKVIEDSCESVLSEQDGKLCGTFGDIACFSTYQCHIMATGCGGLALTDDAQLNDLMRSYANHGRNTAYLPGFRKPKLSRSLIAKRFSFHRNGYSCRPTEFEAALGLGQIERLKANVAKRRDVARALIAALEVPLWEDLKFPIPDCGRTHSYMMFPIVIKECSKVKKTDLLWHLEKRGIETRDMMPLINQPVYAGFLKGAPGFSIATWINEKGFYIPCHPGMSGADINKIEDAFLEFFK